MKRILYVIAAFATLTTSCNYLDFDETSDVYTKEDIYDYYTKSAQMLTNVYSYMPQDFGSIDGAMRDCGSDDAEYANAAGTIQAMNNGNWSSSNTVDTKWSLYYGIRAANEFIESIAEVDFSRFEYNTNYETWMDKLQYHSYEARVLRAHYLFELARRYGDIPMPTTKLSIDQANSIEKSSFEEVIDFIVEECDECAEKLPVTYNTVLGTEYGRATQGFALAVKAKALLYAASPLHNPNGESQKWEAAATAAYALTTLERSEGSAEYSLDANGVIAGNTLDSREIVLVRMNSQTNTFELYNFPVRFTYGNRSGAIYGVFPTQNLADAFQTKGGYEVTLGADGEWICDDPEFDPAAPYANRDPRFERTILANGSEFKGSTIETFEGGADHFSIAEGGSATGYFLRKYIQETSSFVQNATVTNYHYWVIYRYAEALLSYAEALNEAHGPSYTSAEFPISAIEAVDQIRINAGMPTLAATPAYASTYSQQDALREIIRNEWRVEFAFEDHRFWDIRRWGIGQQTTAIYGVDIEKSGEGFRYSRKLYENRYWNDKMNLFPIPQSELFANPNLAPQNSGW
ncbi:MAG: RagB/SusD family nutrient uptake outer membrane protein [Rikenellaceae bacterium]